MRMQAMKVPATVCSVALALALGACGGNANNAPAESASEPETTAETTEATTDTSTADATAVPMTHAEFEAAAIDDAVTVETYVQATQAYPREPNKISVYAQSVDGAYFIYAATFPEEDFEKLQPGTKISVSGVKSDFSGEIEIADGILEIVEGDTFVAEAEDVTALLGTDELVAHQNEKVSLKGLTITASTDAEGNEAAFLYKVDGSGAQGEDIFFYAADEAGNTYLFTVETDLADKDTDAYKAAEALQIGDKVDIEGFLYWHDDVNPHVTGIAVV